MEKTLSKETIITQTALSRLRVRDLEKAYAKNPNPTTLREYKAAAYARDQWDKLFMDNIRDEQEIEDIIIQSQLKN